ncbi:hypothetical protein SynBIOSU31_00775 [Synechococcus sp. BIOS-U3-1]|nr:hypothetical protein SynBIOSU31_00775 [Synechococcus sp. BIOS-U3-1]
MEQRSNTCIRISLFRKTLDSRFLGLLDSTKVLSLFDC